MPEQHLGHFWNNGICITCEPERINEQPNCPSQAPDVANGNITPAGGEYLKALIDVAEKAKLFCEDWREQGNDDKCLDDLFDALAWLDSVKP